MEYIVKGNLKYNGTVYGAGDIVKMDDKTAEVLVKDGMLEPVKKEEIEVVDKVKTGLEPKAKIIKKIKKSKK